MVITAVDNWFEPNRSAGKKKKKDKINEIITDVNSNSSDIVTLEEATSLGSSNGDFYPTAYVGDNHTAKSGRTNMGRITNNSTVSPINWEFLLCEPTNKNSLKLYLNAWKFYIAEADGNNEVYRFRIYGVLNGSATIEYDSGIVAWDTAGQKDDSFTAIDFSGYDFVYCVITINVATTGNLDVVFPRLNIYYA